MKNWYDIERIICLNCGHRWILRSDKLITDEQYYDWLDKVIRQHDEVNNRKEDDK